MTDAMTRAIKKMLQGRSYNPKEYQSAINVLAMYVLELEKEQAETFDATTETP